MTMLIDARRSADKPKSGSDSGFDMMIAAVLDVHPGDTAYARHMLQVSEATEEFNEAHARMVEHYEDGMPAGAARYAALAYNAACRVAALHGQLGADFDGMPNKPVHPNDRYHRNQTGAAHPNLSADGSLPPAACLAGCPGRCQC